MINIALWPPHPKTAIQRQPKPSLSALVLPTVEVKPALPMRCSMAALERLPNELLLAIFHHLPCTDIDSLTLISHRIRNAAKSIIQKHQQLKTEYGVCTVASKRPQCSTVSSLLLAILKQPFLSFYVKHIVVDGWYEDWDEGMCVWCLICLHPFIMKRADLDPYGTEWDHKPRPELEKMIKASHVAHIIPRQDDTEADEGPYLIQLLLLLDNLISLTIVRDAAAGPTVFRDLCSLLDEDPQPYLRRLCSIHIMSEVPYGIVRYELPQY